MEEWVEDTPIKRPVDEIEVFEPHPTDKRKEGRYVRKRIDFGWEGAD